jgi:ketosteroid isomerase-like protein
VSLVPAGYRERLMPESNLEIVRRAYEGFTARGGDFDPAMFHPEFVWDMSKFGGWVEGDVYEGLDGARRFMADWREAWDDWRLEVEDIQAAGDRVLVVCNQHGRSRTSGLVVDMRLAQLWTLRDGKQVRMEAYGDVDEAIAELRREG